MTEEMVKKILVIEDRKETRDLFLECLQAEGFYTIGAENGLIGVHLTQKHLPDLIICGIVMPEFNGYRVLSTLRQNPATAIIPFIFVTVKVTEAERRLGMKLGADDYIIKPCTVEELLGAISTQLEKQTLRQQWFSTKIQRTLEPPSTDTATLDIPKPPVLSNSKLSEVFRFIETNYHRPITLREVAQAVGYSRTYLTNLVGTQTGKTVNRWIVEYRMAKARCLLQQTNLSVEQIAVEIGYQTICHFFRQFRQYHNTTPQAWKKAHQTPVSST